jgi:hypothetical protein
MLALRLFLSLRCPEIYVYTIYIRIFFAFALVSNMSLLSDCLTVPHAIGTCALCFYILYILSVNFKGNFK